VAVNLVNAVDPNDILVTEAIEDASLLQEASLIMRLKADLLQGDVLPQEAVPGEVTDPGHPVPENVEFLIFADLTK
jgi:hypothetical protein